MRKQNFSLNLPDPCHQNWDEMKNAGKGRFCASCAKVVIDFSAMTEQEIISAFVQSKRGELCGRFTLAQLNKQYSVPEEKRSARFLEPARLLLIGLLWLKLPATAQVYSSKPPTAKTTPVKKKLPTAAPTPTHLVVEGVVKSSKTNQGIPATIQLMHEAPVSFKADSLGHYRILIPVAGLKNDTLTLSYSYRNLLEYTHVLDISCIPSTVDIHLDEPVLSVNVISPTIIKGIPSLSYDDSVINRLSFTRRLGRKIRNAFR